LQVEGIVRPRLPVIWVGRGTGGREEEQEEHGNEEQGDDMHMEGEEGENLSQYNSWTRLAVALETSIPEPQAEIQGRGSRVRPSAFEQKAEPSPKRQRTETDPPAIPTPAHHTPEEIPFAQETEATVVETGEPAPLESKSGFPVTGKEVVLEDGNKTAEAGYQAAESLASQDRSAETHMNAGIAATDSDDEMEIPEIDLGESSEDEDEDDV
jgi:hypothetical protein